MKNLQSYMRSLAKRSVPLLEFCVRKVEIYLTTVTSHTNSRLRYNHFINLTEFIQDPKASVDRKTKQKISDLLIVSVMEVTPLFSVQNLHFRFLPKILDSVNTASHNPICQQSV